MTQTTSQDLFISYSRHDKSFVDFLVRCFQQSGLTCFQDTANMKIYDKLDAGLKRGIANSRWLMAVISPKYLQSYWCMFEAMEAIQGQDFESRFLPIVLRHHPDDQTMDEEFVLKALGDLGTEIASFEHRIITAKAFGLSPKLKKLQYVRDHLTVVYEQIQDRIYPQFDLWDDHAVRQSLHDLIAHLAPQSAFDAGTTSLDYARLAQSPMVVPRLKDLPTLVWKTYIGRQARQNTPIAVGNDIFIGSAGSAWNEPDSTDGIYCLDANTGVVKWSTPAPADTNAVLYGKGLVLTGCDDGTVFAVSALTGIVRWMRRLDSGIVGGPIKLPGDIGSDYYRTDEPPVTDPVLYVTANGVLYLIDLHTGGQIGEVLELNATVVAQPAYDATVSFGPNLFVPTKEGLIAFVHYGRFSPQLQLVRFVDVTADRLWSGSGTPEFCAEPVCANGKVLFGAVVGTPGPIVALDARDGTVLWWSSSGVRTGHHFGSVRIRPLVLDGGVVFAAAYSSELGIIDLETGVISGVVGLGRSMFEHWSSPVSDGNAVYIGRHDGYLHKVDFDRKRREWSIYIGNADHAGSAVSGDQQIAEFNEPAAWAAGGSQPILARPLLDRDRLYASTYEGYLFCISNLGT